MVQQSIHGLQLVVVLGGADDRHDVIARAVLPIEDGSGTLVHRDGVDAGIVTDVSMPSIVATVADTDGGCRKKR